MPDSLGTGGPNYTWSYEDWDTWISDNPEESQQIYVRAACDKFENTAYYHNPRAQDRNLDLEEAIYDLLYAHMHTFYGEFTKLSSNHPGHKLILI